jgi:hypothetical protein
MFRTPPFAGPGRRMDRSGQSTLEFALVMLMTLSFTLFFIQLCLVLAWGNYVQYATFMSARAFVAGGGDETGQMERAKAVLNRMVKRNGRDRFPNIAKGVGGGAGAGIQGAEIGEANGYSPTRASSWPEGVRYTFRSRLFSIPPGLPGKKLEEDANSVTFTSESFLLREPTYDECVRNIIAQGGFVDNGC